MSDRSEPGRWVRVMLEFLVIVVGVLVALAFDQWSSDRDDRVNEIAYLSALATDLSVDSTTYADLLIPEATRARSALAIISPVARGVASIPSDTNAFFRLVTTSTFNVTQFGTRRATFDELLATGNLQLIESATLRSSVVSYYETVSLTDNRSAARASGYPGIVRGYLTLYD